MLSNTATPIYYGRFRDQVLRGEIPVCKEISMQMNRIDQKIADPRFYYDDKAINGHIKFCEGELTLTDGSPLHLLDSFKLWAEDALSWFYFSERSVYNPKEDRYVLKREKIRLCNKQYIILGRGGAKSMYASNIHANFENIDKSTTYQVATAPTMKQADEVMSPYRTAIIRARGPLFKFLTEGSINNTMGSKAKRAKLASTKKGIENLMTGSLLEVRPMSIDKLQGLRCKIASVDEWLSGDIREDVIGSLQQSCSKVPGWLIIAISSEGTVRNGPGDTIKMELMSILKGEYQAPETSIWWYKLDSIEEVGMPEMWVKANPNLGKTVQYDDYQKEVLRMEASPSTRNDTLAKRFGLAMEGYTYFFTYEETEPFPRRSFDGMPCSMGIDLSQGDDFNSFTFMFPLPDGTFGIKSRSYISETTMLKLPMALRSKYDEFLAEGSLIVMPGTILNEMDVYDDLDRWIEEHQYDIFSVGYDPYNAKEFIERWATENGGHGIVKVIQGARTESVPLGELKKLAEQRALIFDESIMSFAMGNCIALVDTNGNRKLYKKRYEAKIDPVAAMMDAFIAYKQNLEAYD